VVQQEQAESQKRQRAASRETPASRFKPADGQKLPKGIEHRQLKGGRFASTGGGERARLNASLAVETHELLAELSLSTGLPRAYVIDLLAQLAEQQRGLLNAAANQLGELYRAGKLPANGVARVSRQLLEQGEPPAQPKRSAGRQPNPQREQALEMLLALRQADGTWQRGVLAEVGKAVGVGRQTVHGWARQLKAPEPPAATEIAPVSQNGHHASQRELVLA
jgi:hypothetical protein